MLRSEVESFMGEARTNPVNFAACSSQTVAVFENKLNYLFILFNLQAGSKPGRLDLVV